MDQITYALGKQIVETLENKKALTVEVLDVHNLTPLADLFIIAVGSNVRQTQAMADEVEELLETEGRLPIHKEGYPSATWILLDYGQIIVHILEEENAQFYGLSRLWKDAKAIDYKEKEDV